jgi:hypothetical protein
MDARMITVHDLYAFNPTMKVSIDPFIDIIGRHFKQRYATTRSSGEKLGKSRFTSQVSKE